MLKYDKRDTGSSHRSECHFNPDTRTNTLNERVRYGNMKYITKNKEKIKTLTVRM